eukprot:Awhi_evm1s5108
MGINASTLTEKFNKSRQFSPDDLQMEFCVRELINSGIFKGSIHRGMCKKLKILSRADGTLIIDGSGYHRFHSGSSAVFEILPENALNTV